MHLAREKSQDVPCVGRFSVPSSIRSCNTPATSSIAPTSTLLRSWACIAALAFFDPNAFPNMLRAWKCSELPGSVGLKFLRALTCREIEYTGVGCRISFDDPGRWSARKYLRLKVVCMRFRRKELTENRTCSLFQWLGPRIRPHSFPQRLCSSALRIPVLHLVPPRRY